MKQVDTTISIGYRSLIEEFMKANSLNVTLEEKQIGSYPKLVVVYDENDFDTSSSIMFLSTKNLGLNNMLCDYLQRCGVPLEMISIGKAPVKLDRKKLEADWEEYRKNVLGFK